MIKSDLNIRKQIGLAGRFTMFKGKKGEYYEKVAEFDNLILNSGLDKLGTTGSAWSHISVGTSNVAPTVGQTGLLGFLAASSNMVGVPKPSDTALTDPPYTVTRYRAIRFAEGAAAGNLAEVGIGWSATNDLFARALIKDALGAPTTITILPDEFLDVVYAISLYPPLEDLVSTVVLAGVTYNYTCRAALCGNSASWFVWSYSGSPASTLSPANFARARADLAFGFSGELALLTGTIPTPALSGSPESVGASSFPDAVYVNGTYLIEYNMSLSLIQGNDPDEVGIGGMELVVGGPLGGGNIAMATFQIKFDPIIPKDGTKILNLNFSITWGRYVPPA